MRLSKLALLVTAAMALSAGPAWANRGGHWGGFGHEHHEWHHHHWGGGIIFAPALFLPAFEDPFYLPPAPEVAEPPPVYIERGNDGQPVVSAPSGAWYYCEATGTYYPYVKQCPGGWKVVMAPQQ